MKTVLAISAVTAILASSACGGSSPSAPSTTPAPQRTVITQGSYSGLSPAGDAGLGYIVAVQTLVAGSLEATVDWTLSSSPLGIAFAVGDCRTQTCNTAIISDTSAAKPKTIRTTTVQPATYSLLIVNGGTQNESITYSISIIQ